MWYHSRQLSYSNFIIFLLFFLPYKSTYQMCQLWMRKEINSFSFRLYHDCIYYSETLISNYFLKLSTFKLFLIYINLIILHYIIIINYNYIIFRGLMSQHYKLDLTETDIHIFVYHKIHFIQNSYRESF